MDRGRLNFDTPYNRHVVAEETPSFVDKVCYFLFGRTSRIINVDPHRLRCNPVNSVQYISYGEKERVEKQVVFWEIYRPFNKVEWNAFVLLVNKMIPEAGWAELKEPVANKYMVAVDDVHNIGETFFLRRYDVGRGFCTTYSSKYNHFVKACMLVAASLNDSIKLYSNRGANEWGLASELCENAGAKVDMAAVEKIPAALMPYDTAIF